MAFYCLLKQKILYVIRLDPSTTVRVTNSSVGPAGGAYSAPPDSLYFCRKSQTVSL